MSDQPSVPAASEPEAAETPAAPLDPYAPNAPLLFEFVDENGVVRNLWHVGPSLGREEITLGAIPPLILGRPQAVALAVWLPIALDLSDEDFLAMIHTARASLKQ